MDYKEKYEDLVSGIKGWLDKYVGDWQHGNFALPFDKTGEIAKGIINLVPELSESEDERIRKELFAFVIDMDCKESWIHYLEKQKEQKGKWAKRLEKVNEQKKQKPAEFAPNQFDGITYGMGGRSTDKPVEWSDEDEKFYKTALWHIGYSVSNGKSAYEPCDTTDWLKGVKERLKARRPQARQEQTAEEKEYVRTIKSLVADAIRLAECAKAISDKNVLVHNNNIAFYQRLIDWVEGRHIDQAIAWKKYEEGHRFDSDTVVIGLDGSEPRLVRCAVSACYGIAVKDLKKLPFCL